MLEQVIKNIENRNKLYNIAFKENKKLKVIFNSSSKKYYNIAIVFGVCAIISEIILLITAIRDQFNWWWLLTSIILIIAAYLFYNKSIETSNNYIIDHYNVNHLNEHYVQMKLNLTLSIFIRRFSVKAYNLITRKYYYRFNDDFLEAFVCKKLSDFIDSADYQKSDLSSHINHFKENNTFFKEKSWFPISLLSLILYPFWSEAIGNLIYTKDFLTLFDNKLQIFLFIIGFIIIMIVLILWIRLVLKALLLSKSNQYKLLAQYLEILSSNQSS